MGMMTGQVSQVEYKAFTPRIRGGDMHGHHASAPSERNVIPKTESEIVPKANSKTGFQTQIESRSRRLDLLKSCVLLIFIEFKVLTPFFIV